MAGTIFYHRYPAFILSIDEERDGTSRLKCRLLHRLHGNHTTYVEFILSVRSNQVEQHLPVLSE